jgi:hypothetical protein
VRRLSLALAFVVAVGCDGSPSTEPTASPPPSLPPSSLAEVRIGCFSDLFLFGPTDLASNYDLDTFDAAAIAERHPETILDDPEDTAACTQALADGAARYDAAADQDWPPYGREQLWLWRWFSYYSCANLVLADIPDTESHRFVVGAITAREAAESISRDTDRTELWGPGYDGCLPGLRLGQQLRLTE